MRLAEVLGCFSLGTDLADGFRLEKAMRTAVVASRFARAHAPEAQYTAFWAALVRFVGCTAFAPEEAGLYTTGDDIGLRSVFARTDMGKPAKFLRAVVPAVGGGSLRRRAGALTRLLANPSTPRRHAEAQCEVGTRIAEGFGLGSDVIAVLNLREERWDGRGPRKLAEGEALPKAARIVDAADVADLFFAEGDLESMASELRARRGGQLDPAVVDAMVRDAEPLFAGLGAPSIFDLFLEAEGTAPRVLDDTEVRKVAQAFAHVIDLKSYFTPGHSTGTAALAERACQVVGMAPAEARTTVLAALLHDLGNLALPGGLLDKPGPLTSWETERMRSHVHHTNMVLRAASCLADVASIASAAHEGVRGYPKGVAHTSLPLGARLLKAADAYHAMREPRAFRAPLTAARAEAALLGMASAGDLCASATRAVLEAAGVRRAVKGAAPGLSPRELEVVRLVAIGRTNREIGSMLRMSPRTAQKHVMNIYDKLGVASRAALALHAAEHGLLEQY